MDRRSPEGLLNGVLIGVTTAIGLVLWPSLPPEVAIHFSAAGTPDGYVPRAVGVVLVPAVMVVTYAVIEAAVRYDPPDDDRVATVTTVATMGLLAALHVLVLAWNLGYAVPFELVTLGVLAWGIGLCGYVLRRER